MTYRYISKLHGVMRKTTPTVFKFLSLYPHYKYFSLMYPRDLMALLPNFLKPIRDWVPWLHSFDLLLYTDTHSLSSPPPIKLPKTHTDQPTAKVTLPMMSIVCCHGVFLFWHMLILDNLIIIQPPSMYACRSVRSDCGCDHGSAEQILFVVY